MSDQEKLRSIIAMWAEAHRIDLQLQVAREYEAALDEVEELTTDELECLCSM